VATLKSINSPVWGLSLVGYGVIVEGVAAIRQRIDIAIRTTKGTDPLRPEFGSYVYKFADVPVNLAVPNIKKEILTALQLWVPEIRVISIRHSFPVSYSNPNFEVTFRLIDEDLVDKLLFDLREGAKIDTAGAELTLQAFFPENPNNYNYTLTVIRNDAQLFPMPNPSGFATIQELFQWAKSNLFFIGRWFLGNDRIVLYMKADGVTSASIAIETLPISIFKCDFPSLNPGEAYKVEFTANGQAATPSLPQVFTAPGDVLQWAQNNWGNYGTWVLEFLQLSGEGIFSDEFSDEFEVNATGFRLVGVSHVAGFVGDVKITRVVQNRFQASFPALAAGQFFKVSFKKDGVPVNPNVPTIYTAPGDVLHHAQTYWSNLAQWSIEVQGAATVLVGVGFTSFAGELTIVNI
jgi:phage baseplate assembly protein W